ncbi:MAG: hypothetical protein NTX50_12830 [Candidatus Sumerlaeota bacterium]|nr:hypothetical protein [Candidatus Sumerlaeota bacterium]
MSHMASQEQCDRFNRESRAAADVAPHTEVKSKDDLAHRFTQHDDGVLGEFVKALDRKRDAKIAKMEAMIEGDRMDEAFSRARKRLGVDKKTLQKGAGQ